MPDVPEIFATWASAFVGAAQFPHDIARSDWLERGRLDFSVSSLSVVDDYLGRLHEADENSFSDDEYGNSVLWAAAYFGEVIRRNAKGQYRWMAYEDLKDAWPAVAARIPIKDTTQWVLVEPNGSAFTPVEKVMRRLSYGGDRLYFFADAVLKENI